MPNKHVGFCLQEGADKLLLDLMTNHNINSAICPAQGRLYLRLSANIYNQLSDYQIIAAVLCKLPRK